MFFRIVKNRTSVLKLLPSTCRNFHKHIIIAHGIKKTTPYFNDIQKFERFRSFGDSGDYQIDALKFEEVCEETLESLCEFFEEILENNQHLKGTDVTYGDGVLTVAFGDPHGTYVINRQTPNKQVWLSSPSSGPKRYDFSMKNDGCWIYKHDGISLHQLLQEEINKIVKNKVDFSKCSYSTLV